MVRSAGQVTRPRRRSCAGWLRLAKPRPNAARRARRQRASARRRRAADAVAAPGVGGGLLGALLPSGAPRMPVLDQRQRDVLGLALLAAGVFMGFVLWGSGTGSGGGRAGHAVAVALGWAFGRARIFTPVVLAAVGRRCC